MATVSVVDQYIDITPGVRGGRPRIAGRRITVADVAIMHLSLGFSLDEIAVEYNLPLAAVYAAMAYYHTRRSEIDQQIVDDEAYAEEFQRDYPELVVSKSITSRSPAAPHGSPPALGRSRAASA